MKALVLARLKAVVAILGVVLMYLQAYQTTNPSQWVAAVIAVLTVICVHQVPNL